MSLSVAVFCGSRFGARPIYRDAAMELGQGLAARGMRLVYGGGYVGLMGAVADATLSAGGRVLGVIPEFLKAREVMHEGVLDLVVTDSMHARKTLMFAEADVFVIMPGGLGTFDEMMEILTWRQLGLHAKPIFLVDVAGWADQLQGALNRAIEEGFADPSAATLVDVVPSVASVLARLETIRPAGGRTVVDRL
ncbi:lysine decarboxylase [Ameyamaea chiangmaiensis NBRC 103196]|uniref:Cytokinin riboside 5'-monophosphate phosphoribohydrolase n=1 Tax=Ameyamaea chiangmaiensis TaxID=442969 RepID=A0A850PB17_9PROT|nr:TIGR00730 family Rossman fold protein [Ameyamaea chiangmaiensis]MBS4074964.1 TIGR00730 family Rossman fold protein [Ameyamaea chiangmaiensis]NVN39730.1 TIGR00730 family Rossman fold protein [Ameyamaea chiangmaiensis]GBQ63358.1 lysine decarboxylase [Ameyamaea chiangmaiensis NBRC 103196]